VIYLDNNASTPVDPEVIGVMLSALRSDFGNPSSSHDAGVRARMSLEKARSQVADLIGVSAEEILFTSGGTESNNLAILGTTLTRREGHVITSVIEHPSVTNPCRYLESRGFSVTYAGVGRDGRVLVEEVKRALRRDTVLITIMHANNETGVLQPLEEIGSLAQERGITFHTDAAQTVGKIPVNAGALGVHMMTIVPHKFYGPKGVGGLFIRKGLELTPLFFGAGHERGLRPGTENVPGIVGLGKTCELARLEITERALQAKRLTDTLYRGLCEEIDGVRLNGHETLRLPNTLNISIAGVDALDLLQDLKSVVVASTGSACHSGRREPSSVLKAMGLSDDDSLSAIRLSTGKGNTEEEIKEAVRILSNALRGRGR
jgi:cysteine desulfurase